MKLLFLKYLTNLKSNKFNALLVLITILISPYVIAKLSGSLSEESISSRLKPTGQVYIDGTSTENKTKKKASGPEQIYKSNCIDCHKAGIAGAPKLGNKSDWQVRLAQGREVLLKNAIQGLRGMPPMGNCLDCSEEDLQKTIDYMLEQIE